MQLFRKAYFANNNPAYDGQKLLYSAKRLPLNGDSISGSVTLPFEGGKSQEFTISVKLTGTIDMSPLHNLLQKKNMSEAFQCVETVLGQAYTNSFINVGRRFYTKPTNENYCDLGGGAQMYLGGYQAAVTGYLPFLNVDVAHKAFTKSVSIPEMMTEMFQTRNRPGVGFPLQRFQIDQVNSYLGDLKIVYQIPNHPGSKKVYKVNGLARPANEESFTQNGQQMTVQKYFETKWHRVLKNPNMNTVWVGNKDERICLPMEYCALQPGQPIDGHRLLPNQTSAMINFSATSTKDRKEKINSVMRQANHNKNDCFKEFGFSVGDQFESLKGRVLEPPKLDYCNDKVIPKNGVWCAKKFQKGVVIAKWAIVTFGIPADRIKGLDELVQKFSDYGASCGMSFAKPSPPVFIAKDFDKRALISAFEQKKSSDLVVVIFQNKDAYYTIKQVAELHVGVLTQCIKRETLERKLNESTVRNILLKINSKMNGTNHSIANMKLISERPCMVMGADVTHPGPHARTIPSSVAVTASHDLAATSYNVSSHLQEPKTEIIKNLKEITLRKLAIFFDTNEMLPEVVYFFRDGVSEGEFDKVKRCEIEAIKKACEEFRRGFKPKITFLVVQKRHHTRFFPKDDASTGGGKKFYNVPAGTCVDTVIVDTEIQNFFLCSHASIRGVARPTKYYTLYDDSALSNDDIQSLTYGLCHLFTRCNRAVSYPAPTYWAHLAADRAKTHIHKQQIDVNNLDQRLLKIESKFAQKYPMYFS